MSFLGVHTLPFGVWVACWLAVCGGQVTQTELHALIGFRELTSRKGAVSRSTPAARTAEVEGTIPPPSTEEARDERHSVQVRIGETYWREQQEAVECLEQQFPHVFGGLAESIPQQNLAWAAWKSSPSPISSALPDPWDGRLSPFQRLLLIQRLCFAALRPSLQAFACWALGSAEGTTWCSGDGRSSSKVDVCASSSELRAALAQDRNTDLSLESALARSTARTPCVVLVGEGADLGAALQRVAHRLGAHEGPHDGIARAACRPAGLETVSLADGLHSRAKGLIEAAQEAGAWVIAEHVRWTSERDGERLSAAIAHVLQEDRARASVRRRTVHNAFRLILVADPAEDLPRSVLLQSLQAVCEAPRGIRATLLRTLEDAQVQPLSRHAKDSSPQRTSHPEGAADPELRQQSSTAASPHLRGLLLQLCALHGALRSRPRFGPLGFNNVYSLRNVDLFVAATVAQRRVGDPRSAKAHAGRRSMTTQTSSLARRRGYGRTSMGDDLQLVGGLAFGGGMQDDHDRTVLASTIEGMLGDWEDGGPLWSGKGPNSPGRGVHIAMPAVGLTVPLFESGTLEPVSAAAAIHEFSRVDEPEMLGLHPTAGIAVVRGEADQALAILRAVSCPSFSERRPERGSQDRWSLLAAKLTSLGTQHLPDRISTDGKHRSGQKNDNTATILRQEIFRLNLVIDQVRSTLDLCLAALAGSRPLTTAEQGAMESIANDETPQLWQARSFSSTRVASLMPWLVELAWRAEYLRRWRSDGLAAVFILPAIFFPRAYLQAVMLNIARQRQLPPDEVSLRCTLPDFDVTGYVATANAVATSIASTALSTSASSNEGPNSPRFRPGRQLERPYLLGGFFLEAARWNAEKNLLEDAGPGGQLCPVRRFTVLLTG